MSLDDKSTQLEQPAGSGYQPIEAPGAGSSLKREATSIKTVDGMRLSELLKLSGALARVRTLDIGTIVMSAGVGLLGAAIGAAATGEALFAGVPLFCLAVGVLSIFLGYTLSHERGEEIGTIRRNLDFDIDSWCQDDQDAANMRDRYKKAVQSPSIVERAVTTWQERRKRK